MKSISMVIKIGDKEVKIAGASVKEDWKEEVTFAQVKILTNAVAVRIIAELGLDTDKFREWSESI